MKMLIVLGSPRRGGNGETLARKVAEAVENSNGTVEYVRLNDLNIRPCQGCGGCDKTGRCVIDDDMTALYRQADEADRIVMVSPVYFYGLSAQCKAFGDRMQARWSRKYNLKQPFRAGEGRKGYLISTAATRGAKIFECSVLAARYIYDAMDLAYGGDLLVKGVDKRKDVDRLPDELARAERFGLDIVAGRI